MRFAARKYRKILQAVEKSQRLFRQFESGTLRVPLFSYLGGGRHIYWFAGCACLRRACSLSSSQGELEGQSPPSNRIKCRTKPCSARRAWRKRVFSWRFAARKYRHYCRLSRKASGFFDSLKAAPPGAAFSYLGGGRHIYWFAGCACLRRACSLSSSQGELEGQSPPRIGSNAALSLALQGVRGAKRVFSCASRHENTGILQAVEKSQRLFRQPESGTSGCRFFRTLAAAGTYTGLQAVPASAVRAVFPPHRGSSRGQSPPRIGSNAALSLALQGVRGAKRVFSCRFAARKYRHYCRLSRKASGFFDSLKAAPSGCRFFRTLAAAGTYTGLQAVPASAVRAVFPPHRGSSRGQSPPRIGSNAALSLALQGVRGAKRVFRASRHENTGIIAGCREKPAAFSTA